MRVANRPLSPLVVNLSVSESSESDALGFPAAEVYRTVLRLSTTLIGQGARLAFGHDWRDDGLMESIAMYVERYRPVIMDESTEPLMVNLVPWPDKLRLTQIERRSFEPTLRIASAGLPLSIPNTTRSRRVHKTRLRSIGLTHLRTQLTRLSDARVCLGGRMAAYQGRFPGVMEEAMMSVRARKPLYLIGAFGGAARAVIDAVRGKRNAETAFLNLQWLQDRATANWPHTLPTGFSYDMRSNRRLFMTFANVGVRGLAAENGLTLKENERLFDAQTIDEASDLIVRGLHHCR